MKVKMMDCSVCDGTGKEKVLVPLRFSELGGVRCERCQGTGRVEYQEPPKYGM